MLKMLKTKNLLQLEYITQIMDTGKMSRKPHLGKVYTLIGQRTT